MAGVFDFIKSMTSSEISSDCLAATEKIKGEMQDEFPYSNVIGTYVINYIRHYPDMAEFFLDTQKSLKGSFEYMKAAAQKISENGFAMLSDTDGYALIIEYYLGKGY